MRINSRCQPADAVFTLKKSKPFTLRLGYDPATGQYVETPLETKTFMPGPVVSQFHDSLGYYPGLWYRPANSSLYYWQAEASAVIPAQDVYTTRVSDLDKKPYTDLYGATVNGLPLGTGNPGDSLVQYGLHLAVAKQSGDGKSADITVWNAPTVAGLTVAVDKTQASPKEILKYTLTVTNNSPVKQSFMVTNPIPANTTFKSGGGYKRDSNTIVWTGTVDPGKAKVGKFSVAVNVGTPAGTVITNTATMSDGALGGAASATTTVK